MMDRIDESSVTCYCGGGGMEENEGGKGARERGEEGGKKERAWYLLQAKPRLLIGWWLAGQCGVLGSNWCES